MFKLKTNEVITHSQLADLFHVKTLKQSRFIKEFNTLILVSDYTKGDRLNKWIGDKVMLTTITLLCELELPLAYLCETLYNIYSPFYRTIVGVELEM